MENNYSKILIKEYNENNYNIIELYNINIFKLILIIFLINHIFMLSYYNTKRTNYIKSKMGNYRLYNKFPQITIIINNIEKFTFNEKALKNFLDNLRKQTIIDLQIIFLLSRNMKNEYINIIKNNNKDEKFVLYFIKDKIKFNDIYNCFNEIKGKFTILLEEYILFDKNELRRFYDFTNGKINNVFHFTTKKQSSIYLIKSKVLNDIYDNSTYFKNINFIIYY